MGRYSNHPSIKPLLDKLAMEPRTDEAGSPRRQRRYLTRRQLEALKADYLVGIKINLIAQKHGVSRATVIRQVRAMGLLHRNHRTQ